MCIIQELSFNGRKKKTRPNTLVVFSFIMLPCHVSPFRWWEEEGSVSSVNSIAVKWRCVVCSGLYWGIASVSCAVNYLGGRVLYSSNSKDELVTSGLSIWKAKLVTFLFCSVVLWSYWSVFFFSSQNWLAIVEHLLYLLPMYFQAFLGVWLLFRTWNPKCQCKWLI